MNNNEGRLASLLEMLKHEPNEVFLNYALALEYIRQSDTAKAVAQLNRVIILDPGYVAAYYQQGKLLEQMNRNAEALQSYRKGRDLAAAKNDRKTAGEFDEAIFLLED